MLASRAHPPLDVIGDVRIKKILDSVGRGRIQKVVEGTVEVGGEAIRSRKGFESGCVVGWIGPYGKRRNRTETRPLAESCDEVMMR